MSIEITFGGSKGFAALRPDQQKRVSDIMLSWHSVGGFSYDRRALRLAIRKVLNNNP